MDTLTSSTIEVIPEEIITEKYVNVLVFRTSIRYKKDLKIVGPILSKCTFINHWNIDLDDCDKILRVESQITDPQTIILTIKNAGYNCEELAY